MISVFTHQKQVKRNKNRETINVGKLFRCLSLKEGQLDSAGDAV